MTWHKWIWKVDTMPKIQIFLWQHFYQALLVTTTIIRRGVNLNPSCSHCLEDIETIDFKDCCVTKRVWDLDVQHGWISPSSFVNRAQDLLSYLQRIRSHHTMHQMMQKVSFLLWSMWKCRNKVVFSNEFFNPLACLLTTKKAYAEWRI